MARRTLLAQILAAPLAATATVGAAKAADHRTLKVMIKSAWGSDDPTKAAFPLLHGHALAEAEFWIKNKFILGLMSAHETARYRSIMNPEFCRSIRPPPRWWRSW